MSDRVFREALTDYEREMLLRLTQSSGEMTTHASKVLRYGKDDCPRDRASVIPVNGAALGLEIGNLLTISLLLVDCGLIEMRYLTVGIKRAGMRLSQYLQSEPPHE